MDKKWKNRKVPHLDHIINIFDNQIISAFIKGHLIVESLLVQMVELKLPHPASFDPFQLNFPNKARLCNGLGIINDSLLEFLLEMNTIRNKFAHRLGHQFEFSDAFNFAKLAAKSGVDFSDDTIYSDKEKSKEWYDTEGIIQEVFQNLAQDLVHLMEIQGFDLHFFDAT